MVNYSHRGFPLNDPALRNRFPEQRLTREEALKGVL
jgi:hypothetical protein